MNIPAWLRMMVVIVATWATGTDATAHGHTLKEIQERGTLRWGGDVGGPYILPHNDDPPLKLQSRSGWQIDRENMFNNSLHKSAGNVFSYSNIVRRLWVNSNARRGACR